MQEVDATKTEHPEQQEGKEELVPLEGVYALGDCCANTETPLPALAQVGSLHACSRQSRWLHMPRRT